MPETELAQKEVEKVMRRIMFFVFVIFLLVLSPSLDPCRKAIIRLIARYHCTDISKPKGK